MRHPDVLPIDVSRYSSLAKNTLATFLGRVCAIALGVVLSMVLFRVLQPGLYGLWSLLVLLSAGYSMIFDFGLSTAVEQSVASLVASGDVNGIRRTLNSALAFVAVFAISLEAVAVAAAWYLQSPDWPADVARGLVVLPACIGMTASSLVVAAGLSGLQRMATLHLWRSVGMTTSTVATLALALAGVTRLDVLLVVYAAGGPLAAVGQWVSLRRLVPGLRFAPTWNRVIIAKLLRFGGVLQVATMAPVVADYLFRVLVGARFGISYAGAYDLAARAAIALRGVAGSLFAAMVPFGVHAIASRDREEASRLNRLAIKYTALFILPATVLLFRYAGPLMSAWLGSAPLVTEVQHAFQVLLVAHAITSLAVPAAMLGRSAAQPGPEAVVTTLAVAAGLAGCLFAPVFLPSVVLFGFAVPVGALLTWIWLARRLGLSFHSGRDLAAIGLLSVAGYVTAAIVDWLVAPTRVANSIIVVAASTAAALAVVASLTGVSGVLNKRDRSLLWAAVRRTNGVPDQTIARGIE